MNAVCRRLKPLASALTAVSLLAAPVAEAMTVQPVVIDLSTAGRAMGDVIIVENTFDRPLAVELSVQALELGEDQIRPTGEDTGELAVFPPQASIQPGERQNFRVQYVGDPALSESRHFFVTVAQLPVQEVTGQSNIQLLYNFQVLVSVAPTGAGPAITVAATEIGQNDEGHPVPVITAQNSSASHGYLSRGRLQVVQQDAGGAEIFRRDMTGPEIQQSLGYGLIGGGQTRRVMLPVPLPSAEGTVSVRFSADS